MKPIVSNPKGYHIHSPSAFHLVTEVIFNPDTPDWMSSQQVEELKEKSPFSLLVLKLAGHYKPSRILLVGEGWPEPPDLLEQSGIPVKIFSPQDDLEALTNQDEFVIWMEVPGNDPPIPEEINGCVWFVPGLERKRMRDYFSLLKKNRKVSQSFELKHHGFVIFNSKLQKEDYVIANRGFLIDM